MINLMLKKQEIPYDDPCSDCWFAPGADKPFVATVSAICTFGEAVILEKLNELQALARQHRGLDYLQVFTNGDDGPDLWFIEDGEGGAITALLPEDH